MANDSLKYSSKPKQGNTDNSNNRSIHRRCYIKKLYIKIW